MELLNSIFNCAPAIAAPIGSMDTFKSNVSPCVTILLVGMNVTSAADTVLIKNTIESSNILNLKMVFTFHDVNEHKYKFYDVKLLIKCYNYMIIFQRFIF